MTIFLTGYTGNIGHALARCFPEDRIFALVRQPWSCAPEPGVTLVEGSLEHLPSGFESSVDVIIHSAASTAFRKSYAELRAVNVEGVNAVLQLAERCPRLRKLLHVSTTCSCGEVAGRIAEAPLAQPPAFANAYEQTKWEAENLVLSSHLPVEIARLAIVAGSEEDGAVRRPGALHHALYWLYKGLIPMAPAHPAARVDLISTEFAVQALANLVREETQPRRIVHISRGASAPTVREVMQAAAASFSDHHWGWKSAALTPPDLVDATTFRLFEDSVKLSGDLLFQRVLADVRDSLPGLLHPRTMATSFCATVPTRPWEQLLHSTIAWLIHHAWPSSTGTAYVHA